MVNASRLCRIGGSLRSRPRAESPQSIGEKGLFVGMDGAQIEEEVVPLNASNDRGALLAQPRLQLIGGEGRVGYADDDARQLDLRGGAAADDGAPLDRLKAEGENVRGGPFEETRDPCRRLLPGRVERRQRGDLLARRSAQVRRDGGFECGVGQLVDTQRAHQRIGLDALQVGRLANDAATLRATEQFVAAEGDDGDAGGEGLGGGRLEVFGE